MNATLEPSIDPFELAPPMAEREMPEPSLLNKCMATIAGYEASLAKLKDALPLLTGATTYTFFYVYAEGKVICGVKTRAEFAPVRALHAGAWKKTVVDWTGDEVPYLRYIAAINGVHVSVDVNELPPSCKIMDVEVPAQPATTKRQILCHDESLMKPVL